MNTGLNRIMAMDGSGVVSYYLYDGLGSVANVTDASGNVVCSYTYDAFGAIRTQTGSASNYWGFAGEQRDAESGYIYLRNRYYDTESGRFLSLDPKGNGYPYAAGNPVNNVDPSGLMDCSAEMADGGTAYSNSGGSSGCYDASGAVVACAGTCPATLPLAMTCAICYQEAYLARTATPDMFYPTDYVTDLAPQGQAPADDVSNTVGVVVDESTSSPGAGTSTDGGSEPVQIAPTGAPGDFYGLGYPGVDANVVPSGGVPADYFGSGYPGDDYLTPLPPKEDSWECLSGPLEMVLGTGLIVAGVGTADPALVISGAGAEVVGFAETTHC